MLPELYDIYHILSSFLGECKNGFDGDNMQLQFPCPHCIERDGNGEIAKHNLEVNLQKQVFQCWKCASQDEDMKGSIVKLIKLYGNEVILKDYKRAINSLRESRMYRLNYNEDDFNIKDKSDENKELSLPSTFRPLIKDKWYPPTVIEYLSKRNIKWDIIEKYHIGFSQYEKDNWRMSNRIIIPSYDKYGELNYWTGRDYTNKPNKQKYYNPKVDRKSIIFNEELIQWDADITLVEGPFDHIVVPNSIPLLGKALNENFDLYWEIIKHAKGNINIFLDGDAFETVQKLYSTLNHGRLYNKIRYIPTQGIYDPSLIYQLGGEKAIIQYLRAATKLRENI